MQKAKNMAQSFGADQNGAYSGTSSKKPLGLKLEKCPELLKLMDPKLIEENDKWGAMKKFKAQHESEKLKASNFPASILEIGDWKVEAKSDNDIVAKFYYAKKKIVWEVMLEGRKRKMEIPWTVVSALRVIYGEGKPSTFEIELDNPPAYFVETEPQPRKHTMWITTDDFTYQQASNFRGHTLTTAEGILEKHFNKLMCSSGELFLLSRRPFPKHHSFLFNHTRQYASHFISPNLYHQLCVNIVPHQVLTQVTPLSYTLPEIPLNSDLHYPPVNDYNGIAMPLDMMLPHPEFQEQPVSALTTLVPSTNPRRVGLDHNENLETVAYQDPQSLYLTEGDHTQTEKYQEYQNDGVGVEDGVYNNYSNGESLISPAQMDYPLLNYEGEHNNICDPNSSMAPSSFNVTDEGFMLNYHEANLDSLNSSLGMPINEPTWSNHGNLL